MIISIAGTGYVGLSLAVLLSQNYDVLAVDVVKEKVDMINNRISPINDKEIEYYFAHKNLNLIATLDSKYAYSKSDIIIIATPTNYDAETNCFDTSKVEAVLDIINEVNPNALVVIKSTIPVGYTERIRNKYKNDNIIFSPEFLRESKALYDNLYPSRIIVGCSNNDILIEKANNFALMLKQSCLKADVPILIMGFSEAEAVKLFANSFLALRVSYFNELDTYAEIMNLDSEKIINGVCGDPRIGDFYNNPSFGYGGYCLPKDTKQLRANFENMPQNIISAICSANNTRKKYIVERVEKKLNYNKEQVVGVYKLIMKSNSDNFRDSAIIDVFDNLHSKGYQVIIYDDNIKTDEFMGCKVVTLDELKKNASLIIANRVDDNIKDVIKKVYTRDIYFRD